MRLVQAALPVDAALAGAAVVPSPILPAAVPVAGLSVTLKTREKVPA